METRLISWNPHNISVWYLRRIQS